VRACVRVNEHMCECVCIIYKCTYYYLLPLNPSNFIMRQCCTYSY